MNHPVYCFPILPGTYFSSSSFSSSTSFYIFSIRSGFVFASFSPNFLLSYVLHSFRFISRPGVVVVHFIRFYHMLTVWLHMHAVRVPIALMIKCKSCACPDFGRAIVFAPGSVSAAAVWAMGRATLTTDSFLVVRAATRTWTARSGSAAKTAACAVGTAFWAPACTLISPAAAAL